MADAERRLTAAARVRRLLDGAPGVTPRQAIASAITVTRLALDQLVNDRALFAQAIDRVEEWLGGAVGDEALLLMRADIAAAATRADGDDDRGAWLAMEAVASLLDTALARDPWAVGHRGWRAVTCAAESMAWPDLDAPEIVDEVDARLHDALDRSGAPDGAETRVSIPKR
ncbi:MAG: hypothetical protein JWM10_1394 [Myxococcaceae bacterium]|nr:hypothetical protein [Myxococcaceae bacterium]